MNMGLSHLKIGFQNKIDERNLIHLVCRIFPQYRNGEDKYIKRNEMGWDLFRVFSFLPSTALVDTAVYVIAAAFVDTTVYGMRWAKIVDVYSGRVGISMHEWSSRPSFTWLSKDSSIKLHNWLLKEFWITRSILFLKNPFVLTFTDKRLTVSITLLHKYFFTSVSYFFLRDCLLSKSF
jgi:hypothetical protein